MAWSLQPLTPPELTSLYEGTGVWVVSEPLTAATIERISFDYGIEFVCDDGWVIRIEGVGTVASQGSALLAFDPENPGAAAPVLLGFLHQDVKLSVEQSSLVLSAVDDGPQLRVGPSTHHEAWSVIEPGGSRLICAPDGDVVRWLNEA